MSRHIVIGDIHGCYHELLDLFDRVALCDDDVVVSVGDLVDRGPDSPAVLEFFRERRARGRAVVLMGNHERKHVRSVLSYSQEITRLQFGARYGEAVGWMRDLPYFFETPELVVVHAALMPGVPLSQQREDVLAGTTSGERELESALGARRWHELYDGEKPVAFGHHVVGPEPLVKERVFGLDTGACHGGRLTALVTPGFTLASVPARADHWTREKQKWQEPVLLARPWLDMSFGKAARELERWKGESGPLLDALARWLDQQASLVPALHARLLEEARRIDGEHPGDDFSRVVDPLPHKGLLHLARRGRLDLDAVRQRCVSPRRTIELAHALAVPTPEVPPGVGA